jgi:protein-disulfide isomerase
VIRASLRRIRILPLVSMGMALAAMLGFSALAQTKVPARSATSLSDLEARKTLGSRDAPITIEVFSDYECPACRNFYETTLRRVIDNYVDTGKVYLIHRDFPLPMHPYSRQAARLANAAAIVGRFETVDRALFDKQDVWAANGKIYEALASVISPEDLRKIRQVEAEDSNEINAAIDHDHAMGIQRNVNQTPTIYVTAHGKTEALPGGGVAYSLLSQYLDYLLRQ